MRAGIFIFFVLVSFRLFSQGYVDTLRLKLSRAKSDSERIEILYLGAFSKKLVAKTCDSLRAQLNKFTSAGSCRTQWFAHLKLAMYDDYKDFDAKALDHFLRVYTLAEQCKDTLGMAMAYTRLGAINIELFSYKKGIDIFHKAISLAKRCGSEDLLAENFGFLSSAYRESNRPNLDSALYYALKGLPIREREGNKKKIGNALNTVGLIYKVKKDLNKAVEYLTRSLEVRREVKDQRGIAGACINIANCLRDLHREKEALAYATEGTALAHKIKEGEYFRNGLSSLAELHLKMKDYKSSALFFRRHKLVNDSIKLAAIDKNLMELEEKFESNKKDQELKNKAHAIELSQAESSRKSVLIIFSSIALLMTLVAIIFVYRSYRINKKSALDLARKNKLIEEKNKEITDSINYARNIQHSLLASDQLFAQNCRDHFIYFKPKDIVSGDFYWARRMKDGFMVMCADCTGHGVPGAFMSLLGITHMKEITNDGLSVPNRILDELRRNLIDIFSKNESKDGMDASLIKISGNKLQMSAANNPIWVIRDKQVIHVKPNKFPIGKYYGELEAFSLNEMELHHNDLVVLFTDGYADQFGGPKNKKYKYKRLEEFIARNSDAELADLKQRLDGELRDWRGKNEQIDDVLVIGIRV